MTYRVVPFWFAIGIVCCTGAWAQSDTGAQDTTGPKPAYTYDDQTPAVQPGPQPTFTYPDTTPSLDFLTGAIENSSITLGIGAGVSFDSNGFPSTVSNSTQSRWLFNVSPNIKIQQFFPRFAWNASYAGGLQVYKQVTGPTNRNNNLFSQIVGGGFIWQFAHHWQMLGSENYRHSADPFNSYFTIAGTPTANNPNPVPYFPLSNFSQNNAQLTISNQLTKWDSVSFTGTENYRHTSTFNVVTSVPFYNLKSYGGRAGYRHVVSPRLTLGAGYVYNSLDFGHGQQRSGIQTMEFTADYVIRQNMTISGWVGPEYTSTKTIIPIPILGTLPPQFVPFINHDSRWSTALGFNFGWQSRRNSFRAGYSRQVSDGGGLTATSQVNNVNADYRRQIAPKWSGRVGGRYLKSHSTTAPNGVNPASFRNFENYSFDLGLSYQISKHFTSTATYIRVHQTQSNAFLINPGTYNDNRVGVNISYSWTHPLGR